MENKNFVYNGSRAHGLIVLFGILAGMVVGIGLFLWGGKLLSSSEVIDYMPVLFCVVGTVIFVCMLV
ncbi:MAG: hypothetical protein RR971_07460, partial [Alistipes sp.]